MVLMADFFSQADLPSLQGLDFRAGPKSDGSFFSDQEKATLLPKALSVVKPTSSSVKRIWLEDFDGSTVSWEREAEIYLPNLDLLSIKDCSPMVYKFFQRCQHPNLSNWQLLRTEYWITSYKDLHPENLQDALDKNHAENVEALERNRQREFKRSAENVEIKFEWFMGWKWSRDLKNIHIEK